jgi:hypothetical protein
MFALHAISASARRIDSSSIAVPMRKKSLSVSGQPIRSPNMLSGPCSCTTTGIQFGSERSSW